MDCKTARLMNDLGGNRLAELAGEDRAAVKSHLAQCGECAARAGVEAKFDTAIGQAMRAFPVPAALKSRILDRMATRRGASHRRRLFTVGAAAAAVLLVVGVLNWAPTRTTQLDVDGLAARTGSRLDNANGRAEDWLASLGIAYHAPAPFDSRLLVFHGTSTIQGKQVPALEYHSFDAANSAPVIATVYVIREGEFDLKALPESFGGSLAKGMQAKIFRDRDQPDKLAYVVVFSGNNLDPFLTKYSAT
jgi:hypothetical protein